MSEQVTIVIPTFNRSDLVCKAVDSALGQTVPCNVIVCDHGSTDNTPEVLRSYGDKIFYVRRDRDFGPHFCWLDGVMHAETEFVHIHYDDDLMAKTFIEETLSLMRDDVGFVFTDADLIDVKEGKIIKKNLFTLNDQFEKNIYDIKLIEKKLLSDLMLSPALCLYRRNDVVDALYQGALPIKTGSYYHGVGPDHFISLLALLRYKKFGVVPAPQCFLGVHDGSITMDAAKDEEKEKQLQMSYAFVRDYYRILKFADLWLLPAMRMTKIVRDSLKSVVKKILGRTLIGKIQSIQAKISL